MGIETVEDEQEHSIDKKALFNQNKTLSLMVFTLSGHSFAFASSDIKEILTAGNIIYVPGATDHFLGVIELRGEIESVIDLHHLLEIPRRTQDDRSKRHILIGNRDGVRSGMLADGVDNIIRVPESDLGEVISTLNNHVGNMAIGQVPHKENYVIVLDLGRVYTKIKEAS